MLWSGAMDCLSWLLLIPNGRPLIAEAARSISEQSLTWCWGILLGCSRSRLWSDTAKTGNWAQCSECSRSLWVPENLRKPFASEFNRADKHFPAQFCSPDMLLKHALLISQRTFTSVWSSLNLESLKLLIAAVCGLLLKLGDSRVRFYFWLLMMLNKVERSNNYSGLQTVNFS